MNLLHQTSNRIKQPKECCVYCGKGYKTRTNLEKHLLLCEMLHKRSNPSPEEEDFVPSQKKIYQLLLELGQKYNRLEEKVDEINKWVIRKKKKIDIIEWLTQNIEPSITFEQLSEKIVITDEHIEFLLNNSFNDTLNEIFENTLYSMNENETPIYAFIQNTNTLYIYDKDADKNQNTWTKLSNEKLTRFLNKIQMKISKVFYEWKKTHDTEIKESENISMICNKATIKLMAPDFKQEAILGKVRSLIYTKMKTDVKGIIEYEFDF
jgi:hypothetical protein